MSHHEFRILDLKKITSLFSRSINSKIISEEKKWIQIIYHRELFYIKWTKSYSLYIMDQTVWLGWIPGILEFSTQMNFTRIYKIVELVK